MDKKITSGVLVFVGDEFLCVHPTNGYGWNLPKGLVDEGESIEDAALRELYEETGIILGKDNIAPVGLFPYTKEKLIALYITKLDSYPSELNCISEFTWKDKTFLEVDDYMWITLDDMEHYLQKGIYEVLDGLHIFLLDILNKL